MLRRTNRRHPSYARDQQARTTGLSVDAQGQAGRLLRNVDVDRSRVAPHPGGGGIVPAHHTGIPRRERKNLGETKFREEYLCEFLDTEDVAFSTTIIDAMFTNEVLPLWM